MHTKFDIQVVDQRITYRLFSFRWYIKYVISQSGPWITHIMFMGSFFMFCPSLCLTRSHRRRELRANLFSLSGTSSKLLLTPQKTNQICHVRRGVIVDTLLSSLNIPCRPDDCCHTLCLSTTAIRSGTSKKM